MIGSGWLVLPAVEKAKSGWGRSINFAWQTPCFTVAPLALQRTEHTQLAT